MRKSSITASEVVSESVPSMLTITVPSFLYVRVPFTTVSYLEIRIKEDIFYIMPRG